MASLVYGVKDLVLKNKDENQAHRFSAKEAKEEGK